MHEQTLYRTVDLPFYQEEIAPFLPPMVLDFHAHTWRREVRTWWPGAKIVLAHCGRCYLPAEMEKAIGSARGMPNVFLDTSMVMDEAVLQMVFDSIDSSRVVYGTDLPIAAMRGRRVRVCRRGWRPATPIGSAACVCR